MKKISVLLMAISLSIVLFGCKDSTGDYDPNGRAYDFIYELNMDNYEDYMDISLDNIDGKFYVKYELDEEGYIGELSLTILVFPNHHDDAVEKDIVLTKENKYYEIKVGSSGIETHGNVIECEGTLYSNQFEYIYGLRINKSQNDMNSLNEALEVFEGKTMYTAEYTLDVLDIKIRSKMGFRTDPFYFYNWTPFDLTVYAYEEDHHRYIKRYKDNNETTFEVLSIDEIMEEIGISTSESFLFSETLFAHHRDDHYYIFGTLNDLIEGFLPEDTFEDLSINSEFKMSVKIIDENKLIFNFHVLDDDIDYDFQFVYDFAEFETVDYHFETEY
jgi:hypothetical protein